MIGCTEVTKAEAACSPHPEGSAEALHLARDFHGAAEAYNKRLVEAPEDARTLSNFGSLLIDLGSFEPARQLLAEATRLGPDLPDAWSNLGIALQQLQDYDGAITAYSQCLRLNSTHPLALSNLGVALDARGQHDMALKFHDVASRLDPENAETRTNRAISLLSAGHYAAGFAEYEWRWKTRSTGTHGMAAALWMGEGFTGRTLLIHTEGGFGDMLQFARFVPLAKARGGKVILRLRAPLKTLLSRIPGIDCLVTEDEPVPPHDLQCPVLSLPLALGITTETIPSPDGYLTPDPEKCALWRERIASVPASLRIGLVWAGAPHREIRKAEIADRRRSTRLATLAPLAAAVPGAVFYSLQVGEHAADADTPPPGMTLINHTPLLRDFDDTAALISQLDLVIAVDTSTAHVAAGLGKKVMMLSRYDQCWRWLSGRMDSPWYSSLRLYRQDRPLDWSGPLQAIFHDLRLLAEERLNAASCAPRPAAPSRTAPPAPL